MSLEDLNKLCSYETFALHNVHVSWEIKDYSPRAGAVSSRLRTGREPGSYSGQNIAQTEGADQGNTL